MDHSGQITVGQLHEFIVEGFRVLPFSSSDSRRSFLYFSINSGEICANVLPLRLLLFTDHRQLVLLVILERPLVLSRPGFIDTLYKLLERCLTSRPTISAVINLLANFRLGLFSLELSPCLRERSPIPDSADTERVVPSVSPFVNWHCHCPFPRCSHGRRQFTTRSKTRALFSAASVGKGGKPNPRSANRIGQRVGAEFSTSNDAACAANFQ